MMKKMKKGAVFLLTFCMAAFNENYAADEAAQQSVNNQAAESAEAFIRDLGQRAIDTLTSGSLGDAAQQGTFKSLLDEGFDVPSIAQYVMGRYWRQLAAADQKKFVGKFRDDLARQYASRFKEYRGVRFKVKSSRPTADNQGFWVHSVLIKEATKTAVEWKVYGNKILDVKVEGISMASTKRDETSAAVAQAGGSPSKYVNQ